MLYIVLVNWTFIIVWVHYQDSNCYLCTHAL